LLLVRADEVIERDSGTRIVLSGLLWRSA